MSLCSWCGQHFDRHDAEESFDIEHGLLIYKNIKPTLCFDCAMQAIEDEVEGVYFETCEECGEHFDFFIENSKFSNLVTGTELLDWWDDILCCDCAIERVKRL